jgi:putative DNA primase/helicase
MSLEDDIEIEKIMKEKGVDNEAAWMLLKDRKERDAVEKGWKDLNERIQWIPDGTSEKKQPSKTIVYRGKSEIEQWIWFYYDQGFSVIPLGRNKGFWRNKEDEPKKPSLFSWDKYKVERASAEEIQRWIKTGLFVNVGLVCGHVSNDLVVIDIDDDKIPEEVGLNFHRIKESGAWIVQTGKGYHIYLNHHGNPGGVKRPLKYHIEYRANNGYVVAPPSLHPNGKKYAFMFAEKPEDLQDLVKKDAASIFSILKHDIGKVRNIKEKKMILKGDVIHSSDTDHPACVKLALQTITKHPNRYYTLYGIVSSCVFQKIPIEETKKLAHDFNRNMCQPPHDDDIVDQAINGGYKEDAHLYGCEFWMDEADMCPFENLMECPIGRKKAKRELTKQYRVFDWVKKKNDKGDEYLSISHVWEPRLAKLILGEFDFHFCTTRDTKEIYYFNGGVFHPEGESKISELTSFFLDDQSNSSRIKETINFITHYNYMDRRRFDVPVEYINIENGVYNLLTGELEGVRPDLHFLNKIPIVYDQKATCPKIQKFLGEVLYETDIPVIQEFFGFCLYRRYHIHRAAMFLGGGKNGKSTLLKLFIAFLGKENVSNKELQYLSTDKFATANLYGKLLNCASDLSKNALKGTGVFKGLTGEDMVDAEKKFKNSFSFTNYAKLMFSANSLPRTDDESYAFFRRWILLSFPRTFDGTTCNPNMLEELTTPEELSGLFNWALEGLNRLLKNGDFSYSKSVEDVAEEYRMMSNPIYSFVVEKLVVKTGGYLLKEDVYEEYVKWCTEKQLPIISKNVFTGSLARSSKISEIRAGRMRIGGEKRYVYENIAWKQKDFEESDENDKPPVSNLDNYFEDFPEETKGMDEQKQEDLDDTV